MKFEDYFDRLTREDIEAYESYYKCSYKRDIHNLVEGLGIVAVPVDVETNEEIEFESCFSTVCGVNTIFYARSRYLETGMTDFYIAKGLGHFLRSLPPPAIPKEKTRFFRSEGRVISFNVEVGFDELDYTQDVSIVPDDEFRPEEELESFERRNASDKEVIKLKNDIKNFALDLLMPYGDLKEAFDKTLCIRTFDQSGVDREFFLEHNCSYFGLPRFLVKKRLKKFYESLGSNNGLKLAIEKDVVSSTIDKSKNVLKGFYEQKIKELDESCKE